MKSAATGIVRRPRRIFGRMFALILFIIVTIHLCWSQTVQYLSPLPGSALVSQQTNIILKTKGSLDPSIVADPSILSVRGTVTGDHSGALILSDDSRTIVFTPTKPFAPGEAVTVKLVAGLHTQEGSELESQNFQFQVSPSSASEQAALLVQASRVLHISDLPQPTTLIKKTSQFERTETDTLPPDFSRMVVVKSDHPSTGDLFLGTFKLAVSVDSVHASLAPSIDQYLLILDNQSVPVFDRKMTTVPTDFKVQVNGLLTYFDSGKQEFYELDNTYSVVDSFRCGNGYQTDNHELIILPNGHALILGLDPEVIAMNQIVPGGNIGATVIGNVIQELDEKKNVVFQWRTFDHFKITDATHENLQAGAIDYVHANALDLDTDGNILMSSRHMDEITKIDHETGAIIWRWGGKNNQFSFTNDPIGFSHQHCIRRTPTGTLMMFDDGDFHSPRYSRGVEYTMDEQAMSVTEVWEFRHIPDTYAAAMGSVQRLPDGNTLIGWGTASPAVTEIRSDGSVAYELQLPDSVVSYRAFRFPWNPNGIATSVGENSVIPTSLSLAQNYPNPFNPSTVIQFSLPQQAQVSLKVYDAIGREISTLAAGSMSSGTHSVQFDASRLSSGVYYYRLTSHGQVLTKMMVLLK